MDAYIGEYNNRGERKKELNILKFIVDYWLKKR